MGYQFPAREGGSAVLLDPHNSYFVWIGPALRRIVIAVVEERISPVHHTTDNRVIDPAVRHELKP